MAYKGKEVFMGIDIGTSNYSFAMYYRGAVEQLDDEAKSVRNPCMLLFLETRILVGLDAEKWNGSTGPEPISFEAKRFIGRQYDDPKVQAFLPTLTYEVQPDSSNNLVFFFPTSTDMASKTPDEIYNFILRKIKTDVDMEFWKNESVRAVITVPAHFKTAQKEAIFMAADYADFEILELLDETAAIALKYFTQRNRVRSGHYFAVYNMGGGDFSIGVFKVMGKKFHLVAASGDTGLSGRHFDYVIFDYMCDRLKVFYDFDPRSDIELSRKLLAECEEAKINVSVDRESLMILKHSSPCFNGLDTAADTITKRKFEKLAKPLIEDAVILLDQCLYDNNLSLSSIEKIILCGGISKIPKLRKTFYKYFGPKVVSRKLTSQASSVAEGAALYAGMLKRKEQRERNMN